MRKLITIAALLLAVATAQSQSKYDNGYKYGLLSNIEVIFGGAYSYDIESHYKNAGGLIGLTKRIDDNWRVRGEAFVDGFIPNGFDRKGMFLAGISFDLLPWYIYGEYGINYNPSAKTKIGLAAKAGTGLQFKLSDISSVAVGGNFVVTNNGNMFTKTAGAEVVYVVNCGITEQDRVRKSIDDNVRSEYGELKGENKILKSELQKCQDATASIQESAAQMAAMVETLQTQLNESKAEVKTIKENCGKTEFYPIVFDFASYEITDAMDDYIADYAEMMRSNNYEYRILGYCSANGTDWKNQLLSEKRANAVYRRLILYGVDESRLYPEGKGMSDYDKASEQKVIIVRIER